MRSTTLEQGLAKYAIGDKLRRLRLGKSLGLVQLGEHTGLSPAMLSKLERGKAVPTLPTLLRIAMVFSVGLEYFFTEDDAKPELVVVRRSDRLRFPSDPRARRAAFVFESLDFPVNEPRLHAYLAEFGAVSGDRAPMHEHDGIELLYVITGRLDLVFRERREELAAGDAAYFDSSQLHGYRRLGSERCTGLVVTVPDS